MSTDTTTHRALTKHEFDDGCGCTFRGVPLCEDERGEHVYAYGHRGKVTFARAVDAFDREMQGYRVPLPEEHCRPDEVCHLWATTIKPADDTDSSFTSPDQTPALTATHYALSPSTAGSFRMPIHGIDVSGYQPD